MCCLSNELTDVYINKNNEQDTTLFRVSLRKRATLLAQLSPLNMQTICPDFSQLREAGQPEPFPGQPEIGSGWLMPGYGPEFQRFSKAFRYYSQRVTTFSFTFDEPRVSCNREIKIISC